MTTILVVEDNERLATGLRSNLEFEGYRVVVAGTAEEGLRCAKDASPDLVLLDLMLPDADGYRVLRDLRERGLVTLRDGVAEVHDAAGLSRLGEFDPTYLYLDEKAIPAVGLRPRRSHG